MNSILELIISYLMIMVAIIVVGFLFGIGLKWAGIAVEHFMWQYQSLSLESLSYSKE